MDSMKNTFSFWMRYNLKDAYSGLIAQDIDFAIIQETNKKFYFIEEKNSDKATVRPPQKIIFKMFDDLFEENINGYNFLGTHIMYISREMPMDKLKEEIRKSLNNRQIHDIDENILRILWDCKGQPLVRKTEKERSGYRGSIIRKILETSGYISKPGESYIEHIDWIFLNYCTGYFILVEEMTDGKTDLCGTKKEFIKIMDNLFTIASNRNQKSMKAKNPKSGALYKYLGYYKLVFSRTNPDNSNDIFLNDQRISKTCLVDMFNLDNNSIEKFRIIW